MILCKVCENCLFYDLCSEDQTLINWAVTTEQINCVEMIDLEFTVADMDVKETFLNDWDLIQDKDWLDWLNEDSTDNKTIKFVDLEK
jgi:hypothetical protein